MHSDIIISVYVLLCWPVFQSWGSRPCCLFSKCLRDPTHSSQKRRPWKAVPFIWITPGASQVTQWVKNLPATQETQKSQVWFPGLEEPLEKGMAIHSSILAWRNPWTKRHLEVCVHRAAESWHDEWLSTQAQHAGGASGREPTRLPVQEA